ncbi:MAG: hypothetical protein MUO50_04780 [Longimicrobiales bacterium]|nr:hypothetical protein [Longimicrobiales bacterium]
MSPSEYSELVTYLASKFEALEASLARVEDRLARVEVAGEENRHQIQILAEGITALRSEMGKEFAAVRTVMAEGFAGVWSEFGNVRKEMAAGFQAQSKLIGGIGVRVDRLEGHRA